MFEHVKKGSFAALSRSRNARTP